MEILSQTPLSFSIMAAFDGHVHFRGSPWPELAPPEHQDYLELIDMTVPLTAQFYDGAIVMPNTKPNVLTGKDALAYHNEIKRRVPPRSNFTPMVAIMITPQTTEDMIYEAHAMGVRVGKTYTRATTYNSQSGMSKVSDIKRPLRAMEKCGMVGSFHPETPEDNVDCIRAEAYYFQNELQAILDTAPSLKIVMEHLSSKEAAEFMMSAPAHIGATITPHHLMYTMNNVRRGVFKPLLHCLPEIKGFEDLEALWQLIWSDRESVFAGTDSAPHPFNFKIAEHCCGGIFNAPVSLQAYATLFEQRGMLDERFERFVSLNGRRFYNVPPSARKLTFIREEMRVPKQYRSVIPMEAGGSFPFSITALSDDLSLFSFANFYDEHFPGTEVFLPPADP